LPGLDKLAVWQGRHVPTAEDSLLAAISAAWALGIPLNLIGAGIEAFNLETATERSTREEKVAL